MHDAAVDKRERTLAEIVIVILLLSVLMASFIHYFFKNQAQINKVAFNNLVNNFTSQVLLIHGQWLMSGKPEQLLLKEVGLEQQASKEQQQNATLAQTRKIFLNKAGWVSSKVTSLACQKIWQQVMATPMIFGKQPLAVVQLLKKNKLPKNSKALTTINNNAFICRFSIETGLFFEYYSKNGRVSIDK
jgi:competence protein ComGC